MKNWHNQQPIPGQHAPKGFVAAKPRFKGADQIVLRRHAEQLAWHRFEFALGHEQAESALHDAFAYTEPDVGPSPKTLKQMRELVADEKYMSHYGHDLSSRLGLDIVGRGHFSVVFGLGKRRVLKIVLHHDPSYERFVEKCLGTANPHFPKIYWKGFWGQFFVVVLERLETGHSDKVDDAISAIRAFRKGHKNQYLTITCPILAECGQILGNHTRDLRDDNVLSRADGTPVFTDPMEEYA